MIKKMIILGIDPGYERLGVAVLEKDGNKENLLFSDCIKTSSKLDFHDRLALLGKEVKKIIKKWKPDIMSIEKIFFTTNQKTAMSIAEVRGMLIYLAVSLGADVMQLTPLEIKIALTGYGKADKKQIKDMVEALLKIKKMPKYDDEIDAIAAALTCSVRLSTYLR